MKRPTTRSFEVNASLLGASFLFAQFILIWTTFFILSVTINWPASLDDPADISLPRLLANEGAVLAGYGCYFLAALLLVPATAALNARLSVSGPMSCFTMALATLAALAKAIGISRWLFVMPDLARAYAADQGDRPNIVLAFDILNDYAGGVGEVLGVGLMGGVWTILMAGLVLRSGERRRGWVGWFAVIAGASLFLAIPAGFGVDLGPVLTFSNIAWQFSLLGIAIWVWRLSPSSSDSGQI